MREWNSIHRSISVKFSQCNWLPLLVRVANYIASIKIDCMIANQNLTSLINRKYATQFIVVHISIELIK